MKYQQIQSDQLVEFRAFIDQVDGLEKMLGRPISLRAIVDANVIYKELLWLTKTRKNPAARTNLQEVVDAGCVALAAPSFLLSEMEKHIPNLAKDHDIELHKLEHQWESYKTSITFIDIPPERLFSPREGDDPKDIPYVVAEQIFAAQAVLTVDSDLARMGANAVEIDCLLTLRNYSRDAALEFSMRINGYLAANMSLQMASAAIKGIGNLFGRVLKSIPTPILWGGLAVGLIALWHQPTRQKIGRLSSNSLGKTLTFAGELFNFIEAQMSEIESQSQKANSHLKKLPPNIEL